jgi:hypothetical protein
MYQGKKEAAAASSLVNQELLEKVSDELYLPE